MQNMDAKTSVEQRKNRLREKAAKLTKSLVHSVTG